MEPSICMTRLMGFAIRKSKRFFKLNISLRSPVRRQGSTTKDENDSPFEGGQREGDVPVGCAGVAATETPPSACGAFPPLTGGIFREASTLVFGHRRRA